MEVLSLGSCDGAAYAVGASPDDAILFGCFSEANKRIAALGWKYPHTIVLPERTIFRHVAQIAPEFLFYGHIFRNGNFDFRERKVLRPLRFVGTPDQLRRVRAILEISYLGTMDHVLDVIKPEASVREFLAREGDYFALTDLDGKIIPLSDYIELVPWADDRVALSDGTAIIRLGTDEYEIARGEERAVVHLAWEGDQPPVWTIPPRRPGVAHRFAISAIGTCDGFDPSGPSTTFLLSLGGRRVLIDCAPYADRLLAADGILPDAIDAMVITHVHEDHTGGLPAFVGLVRRLRVITTPEIWRAVLIKLAASLDRAIEDVAAEFDYVRLPVGEPFVMFGAVLTAFYSCHSVPAIGFRVDRDGHAITFSGDIAGRQYLDRMSDAGALSPARYDEIIEKVYAAPGTVIVDAGEAIIHGYPREYVSRGRRNLYLSHRSAPAELDRHVSLFAPGMEIVLAPGNAADDDARAVSTLLAQWEIEGWTERILAGSALRELPDGSVIIAEGERDASVAYVICRGICGIEIGGVQVAQVGEGDVVGEGAFLDPNEMRTADVVARSAVRLVAIPGALFRELLSHSVTGNGAERVEDRLRKVFRVRPVLQKAGLFDRLPTRVINRMSLTAEEIVARPGDVTSTADALFIVADGNFRVHYASGNRTFGPHEAFGVTAHTNGRNRSPEYARALSAARLVRLSNDALADATESPAIRRRIAAVLRGR